MKLAIIHCQGTKKDSNPPNLRRQFCKSNNLVGSFGGPLPSNHLGALGHPWFPTLPWWICSLHSLQIISDYALEWELIRITMDGRFYQMEKSTFLKCLEWMGRPLSWSQCICHPQNSQNLSSPISDCLVIGKYFKTSQISVWPVLR